jgi:hypothetical protein
MPETGKESKMAVKTKRKNRAEIINLPEEYILRTRYTQFLHDRGKLYKGRMLICWYIGPESGRLMGVFWKEGEEVPWFMAFNIAKNGALSFDDEGDFPTWGELFDLMRRSPKNCYLPSMAYVFSGCVNSVPRDYGKVIQFPQTTKNQRKGKQQEKRAANQD